MAHLLRMPKWIILLGLLALHFPAFSQEAVEGKPVAEEIPSVADCIPPWVSTAEKPGLFPFNNGLVIAITTANQSAQIHTLQGLNHLHAGWDFEAIRHFAVAMEADPRCMMAHWGMIMAMLGTSPETDSYRLSVSQRLLQLVSDGDGTELERGFAYSLIKYIEEGPKGAETAFRKVSEKFPQDIQSQIFAALFSRGGYDLVGKITASQSEAEKRLLELVERLPDHSIPLHAYLLVRAEAPDLKSSVELARKLCELTPKHPSYLHLLCHYQWRSGEFDAAVSSFSLAESQYAEWMRSNKIAPADCPQWIQSKSYLAIATASAGNFKDAVALAAEISKIPLDPKRPLSPGNRQILWDAQNLAARIILYRGGKTAPTEALVTLPSPDSREPYRKHSISHWWTDGIRIALQAHRMINAGDMKSATDTVNTLSLHGESMAKQQTIASTRGEYAEWRRALLNLEMLTANLRGHLALAGPPENQGSAFNWFRAAADRQRTAASMHPPFILTPMAVDLGDYLLSINQPEKALEAYREAIAKFPNEASALERIKNAKDAR
jgi:tetratricopeptide (TPR) repeat protein